jgi:hypothetical protein
MKITNNLSSVLFDNANDKVITTTLIKNSENPDDKNLNSTNYGIHPVKKEIITLDDFVKLNI